MALRVVLLSLALVATARADGMLGTNHFFPATPVEGLGKVTALGSSRTTNCAVVDGEVFCWGSLQNVGADAATHVPTKLAGLTGATQISVWGGLCARLASGQVRCLGPRFGGATPRTVAGLARVKKVSVGSDSACALRSDGRVLCWRGANGAARATPIADGVDIGVWADEACAARANGTVSCFPVDEPARQRLIADVKDAVAVTSSCVLDKRGAVRCWDVDYPGKPPTPCGADEGAVSLGDHADVALLRSGSVVSIGLVCGAKPREDVTDAVEASGTCALRRDGTVLCWGRNDHGELGTPAIPARRKR